MNIKTNKNFIYNLIYEIVIVLTPLIMVPYVSRIFGAELIGVRSYTFTILSYFELFATLGITIYGQKEIAKCANDKDKRSKILFELLIVKLISFSICLLTYSIVFFQIGLLSEYKLIFAVWIIHFAEIAFSIVWYFQGVEKFRTIAIRGVLLRAIQIVCTLVFVKTKNDFELYIFFYAIFPLLQTLTLWPFLIKDTNLKMIRYVKPFRHMKSILVFFIPTIATTLYSSIDKVMLGSIASKTETGYYESAFHIITLATSIFVSYYTVMRSRMSNLAIKEDISEYNNHLKPFMKVGFMVFIPVAIGIFSVSHCFTLVFFGEEYEPVVNLLREFSPILLVIGLSGLISAIYIVPFEKQKFLVIFYLIALVINVSLNAIFIPLYGAYGAVIGSISSELSVLIGCIIISRKQIKFYDYLVNSYKYIISGLVMGVIVFFIDYYVPESIMYLLLELVVGVATYGLCLLLLREELSMNYIKKIFHRK